MSYFDRFVINLIFTFSVLFLFCFGTLLLVLLTPLPPKLLWRSSLPLFILFEDWWTYQRVQSTIVTSLSQNWIWIIIFVNKYSIYFEFFNISNFDLHRQRDLDRKISFCGNLKMKLWKLISREWLDRLKSFISLISIILSLQIESCSSTRTVTFFFQCFMRHLADFSNAL